MAEIPTERYASAAILAPEGPDFSIRKRAFQAVAYTQMTTVLRTWAKVRCRVLAATTTSARSTSIQGGEHAGQQKNAEPGRERGLTPAGPLSVHSRHHSSR